jgi:hypothetical protein
MRRPWLRALVSFLCGFALVFVLYRTSSELSAHVYPPPPRGSWREIWSNIAERTWAALDWSGSAFYAWFPPERGATISVEAIVGPIVTNIVIATFLFYFGITLWTRRRAQRTSKA